LEEKHHLDASDRTVRRFVLKLREEHGISRETEPRREYEAVEELPMGFQLQLDFGEKSVRYAESSRYMKLYFAVFTLSYSRYMWGVFQPRPFCSADLVSALYGCFDYFGGKPRQLVYDQDSIIVVSENGGDIIHTQAFAAFLAESKLEIRACRKSDPETKGLVESSVKFVKGNFVENRLYMGVDIWNRAFEDWLIQAAKRKHGTTKRKPVEMFAEEQEHLLPLYGIAPAEIAEEMNRVVRKDNTIWYRSNRYSVPFGTYGVDKNVFIDVQNGELRIMNRVGEPLGTHKICEEKGRLIKLESHRRDRGEKLRALRDNAVALLGSEFREYLEIICEKKPRYVKDQLSIILAACETYGRENVLDAMRYCRDMELYSANDLRDAAGMISGQTLSQLSFQLNRIPLEDERYHILVQKRELSVYADAALGSGVTQ
jgi:transposase